MYKVTWVYRTELDEFGDEQWFDDHESAQAFFYTIMRRPGVSGAEMIALTEEEIQARMLGNDW